MPVPEGKIYNDAPDEFAEFLDSERTEVSLRALGGVDNPFVKEGIYKESEYCITDYDYYAYCPVCGKEVYFDDDPGEYPEYDPLVVACNYIGCGTHEFAVRPDDCKFYVIDHIALAEFMSKGLGCAVCRQFKKTGWQFGKLRGYDVYFACSPTAGMYRALESTPKSVLVIGQNTPKNLPPAFATRVIYLSRLLYVKNGALQFANEVVEEKIPLPQGGARPESGPKEKQTKKPPRRWPIQAYAPFYISMMAEWLDILRREDRVGQPTKEWMVDWLYRNGASPNRKHLSTRQIYRHIEVMTSDRPPEKGKPDLRVPVFANHWNGCEDRAYVATYSENDFGSAVMDAWNKAKKMGFDVGPMRGMDAADFADKSDGQVGRKRCFRTHVD